MSVQVLQTAAVEVLTVDRIVCAAPEQIDGVGLHQGRGHVACRSGAATRPAPHTQIRGESGLRRQALATGIWTSVLADAKRSGTKQDWRKPFNGHPGCRVTTVVGPLAGCTFS